MKKVALIIISSLLVGCGLQSQINELKDRSGKTEAEIIEINKRIATLSSEVSNNIKLLDTLSANVLVLTNTLHLVWDKESTDYANLLQQINNTSSTITTLQTTVTIQTSNIVTLQTNENITAFHDFCGTTPNVFNEVGMITSSGKIVVYFESGGSRYLSILSDGNYGTTDGTNCFFTVSNNGTVITNEHF